MGKVRRLRHRPLSSENRPRLSDPPHLPGPLQACQAKPFLDKWYFWAPHSRIPAIVDVAKTIRRHQDGILRWFTSGINNGILEAINSLVQAAKAKARGYRSDRTLATIIYLIAGKLDLTPLPT